MRLIVVFAILLAIVVAVESRRDDDDQRNQHKHHGHNKHGRNKWLGNDKSHCDNKSRDKTNEGKCSKPLDGGDKLCGGIRACNPNESCVPCTCQAECAPVIRPCAELFKIDCERCQCNEGYLRTSGDQCILESECLVKG